MRFTVYVDRDVWIEASNDREAELIAKRAQTAVDEAVAVGELKYGRTTCHRGERNKMVFDHEVTGDDDE